MDNNSNINININTNADEVVNDIQNVSNAIEEVSTNTQQATTSQRAFNASNESTRRSVLQSGGAVGLLAAATGGLSNDFRDAVEVAGEFGISLRGLRGIIAATVVGFVALGILELITNWDKWIGLINGSTAALEKLNIQLSNIERRRTNQEIQDKKNIANAEEEIRKLEAKGIKGRELITAYEELDKVLENSYENSKKANEEEAKTLEIKLKNIDEVNEAQDEYNYLLEKGVKVYNKFGIGQGFRKATEEELNKAKLNLEYEQDKTEEGKRLNAIKKENADLENQINKIKGNPTVRKLEEDRLTREKAIEEAKKRQNELIQKQIELQKKLEQNFSTIGKFEEQFGTIGKSGQLFKDLRDLNSFIKEIGDNLKKQNESLGVATNTLFENQDQKLEQIKLKRQKLIEDTEKFIKELYVSPIDNVKLLEQELFKLQNGLLEFEKGFEKNGKYLDDRFNNSDKFIEIENRLNLLYNKRNKILDNTFNKEKILRDKKKLDNNETLEEVNNEIKRLDELFKKQKTSYEELKKISEKEKIEKPLTVSDINFNKEIDNARFLVQIYNEQEQRKLSIQKENKTLENEQIDADNQLKLEKAQLTAEQELEIEINKLERKRLLREEELERERLYYDATVGIAEEAGNFLNGLAQQGDKNSQKYAEAALKLQKAAGVARVAIALQEEIRGIWSNPALTALPDTGVAKKTLLTIGASARGALSIATILAQKLNGNASSTASNQGGGPQAQFNIVESSGTNQLAATIAGQQNQPVNAYVVGSDVSTQQALDRNKITNATFLSYWLPLIPFISLLLNFI